MIDRIDKFKNVLTSMNTLPIVLTQVDPDSIGSAMLLRQIALSFNLKVEVYYCGHFGHPQNRTIYSLYDLGSIFDPISIKPSEIKKCAIVDSSQVNDARLQGYSIEPVIIIDHHEVDTKNNDEDENSFILIERVGASSTLVAELVFALNVKLEKNSREATLGALGIFNDTKMLTNATERDVIAYSKILEYADKEIFRQLHSYPLPQRYFEYFKEAITNWKIKESRLVTGIGFVSSKEADQLSIITDSLIRMPEIQIAIAWGIVDYAHVRISARCTDPSLSFYDFLKERFGQNSGVKTTATGVAEGGALIKLPSGFWSGDDIKEELLMLVKRKMEYLILEDIDISKKPAMKVNISDDSYD
ncbi:TrkA-N domain-containing protein [Candidatus Magnetoovum chiemensis]|nr:TrkA-N domain-containing protein [Candidatus Magnetoovum chiemensis]